MKSNYEIWGFYFFTKKVKMLQKSSVLNVSKLLRIISSVRFTPLIKFTNSQFHGNVLLTLLLSKTAKTLKNFQI